MADHRKAWVAAALLASFGCGTTEHSHSGAGGAVASGGSGGDSAGLGGARAEAGGTSPAGGSGGLTEARTPNPWSSSAVPLGTSGWQTSEEPFCDVHQGDLQGSALWADARGVFAVVNEACIPHGRDLPSCSAEGRMAEGTTLNFNAGSGWRVVVDQPLFDLTGFENGPLLSQSSDCALLEIEPGTGTTSCALAVPPFPSQRRTFPVRAGLAYAIIERSFYALQDGSWTKLIDRTPETLNAIWANDTVVYVAGEYGLYSYTPGASATLTELPNAPAAYYTSAWGFADDDVWFGNSGGQLVHYDGHGFTRLTGIVAEYQRDYHGIQQLWGREGVLYFSGWNTFGRVIAGRVETLIDGTLADAPVQKSFWGTSPNDVFLAVGEPALRETPCASALFLYFDGNEFHRF